MPSRVKECGSINCTEDADGMYTGFLNDGCDEMVVYLCNEHVKSSRKDGWKLIKLKGLP